MILEVEKFTLNMTVLLDPNKFRKILIYFLSKASVTSDYIRSLLENPYNC